MIPKDPPQDRLDTLFPQGGISLTPLGEFIVTYNAAAKGAKISFNLRDKAGIFQILLKRNYSLDEGSATALQTWTASAIKQDAEVNYDDLDPDLKNQSIAYYWLVCAPILDGASVTVGPQKLVLNLDQNEPDAITDFDASHGALVGNIVNVAVAFVAPSNDLFGSCKIYISGYQGITDYQALAQSETSPFDFNLLQTGETVTLKAVAVSINGIESTAVAPTKSLTLGTAATVPAKPMGVVVQEIATGVQVSFPANAESTVTSYKVYRAALSAGFGASVLVNTVVSTGAAVYVSLDVNGLKDVYEYYVVAVNGTGDSSPSTVAIEDFIISSSRLPINSVQYTNNATINSIDAGASATVQVFGPGGVGTAWDLKLGYGSTTVTKSKPAQTFTGKSYVTAYLCYWNGSAFVLTTSYFDVLPDGYYYVGPVTTVAAGGGGGSSGGGGSAGRGTCFSGDVEVLCPFTPLRFDAMPEFVTVLNKRGVLKRAKLSVHEFDGVMLDMGSGRVTKEHEMWMDGWKPAIKKFNKEVRHKGKVYDLTILGESDFDEQCYQLANGDVAHNKVSPE